MLYLLDTSTCIAAMRKHPRVMRRMAMVPVHECGISTITSFELQFGVERCAHPAKERAKVDRLTNTYMELEFDLDAAREAARIRAFLERYGTPIGPYDTLLAGHVLSLSLIVVTGNVNEFSRVPGLTVENWQV